MISPVDSHVSHAMVVDKGSSDDQHVKNLKQNILK